MTARPKMPPKRLTHDAYRVGWICPLEVEQIAAMEMLDEEHERLPQPIVDTNIYNLGSINNHNVVIAGLPRQGNCFAATVITQMRMTFPSIKYGLLVGIGGGVPVRTDHGMIRLGHVVVSEPTGIHSGAVQYDHGKARTGCFERNGALAPPPTALLNAAREVAVSRQRMDHDPIWKNIERIQTDRRAMRRFKSPGTKNDHLYRPDYEHRQQGIPCEEGGCDPKQRIERPMNDEDGSFVVVHRGTIASGELVIKDARKRDDLAQEHGVLCFEMEAAGALTDFPCMVIRGISDYCDSHKNDMWHGFAAVAAAAFARELFFHMSIEEKQRNFNLPHATFDLPFNLSEISEVAQFVARGDELSRMQEVFKGTVGRRTATVHGLGGIGKTQLAIAYAKQHRSKYSAMLWLNARNETTLKQSFARIADWILRNNPLTSYIACALENPDLDQTVKAVKRWLNEPTNSRWLVVYDNYDNPLLGNHNSKSITHGPCIATGTCSDEVNDPSEGFDLRRYLPETDHGAIIVTTRSSLVKLGQAIHLGKLSDINDSLRILASVSGRECLMDDPAALNLAKRLDGHPLALATAGAYLEHVSMGFTEYLELYNESWLQLHKVTPRLATYDKALYSTWNISYRYIEQQSPIAAMLLQQWAYFDHEDLWYELLKAGKSEISNWLESLTRNKLTFHESLRVLCNHGLVEPNPPALSQRGEMRGYSMHGCVHSWVTHVLNQKVDREMVCTAIQCVAACVPKPNQREFWLTQRRLITHADRCLGFMRDVEVGDEVTRDLHSLGRLYADQGRILEAEAMYQRSLGGREKTWGLQHTSTLDTVNNLGILYMDQGRLADAEAMYERALQGKEKSWGPEHTSTLETVNNLGVLYEAQGRFAEAEAMYERALQGQEKSLGPEHTSTLAAVENLGNLYARQGRLAEAETMYERALQGQEKSSGPEHTSTLEIVNNLGVLYSDQGRLAEAEAMYQRALPGKAKAWGQEHPSTLNTIVNLGALYRDQGRLPEAETAYKRALQGEEKLWGPEHTSTLEIVNNLGVLYSDQGRLAEAEAMYQRALQGFEKVCGPEHPSTLDAANNLGVLYMNQGRFADAEAMYQQALSGRTKTSGLEHTSTLDVIHNLGLLYADQGRLEAAEAMYEQALQGYRKALGPILAASYIPAVNTRENFGNLCIRLGKVDEALSYYRQARDGAEFVWGRKSQRYTRLSNKIASAEGNSCRVS